MLHIGIALLSERCPEGERDTCGFRCDQLCHSWRAATYQCLYGEPEECCLTCGEIVHDCLPGQMLRDEVTCVAMEDCPCLLPNGNILAVEYINVIRESLCTMFDPSLARLFTQKYRHAIKGSTKA